MSKVTIEIDVVDYEAVEELNRYFDVVECEDLPTAYVCQVRGEPERLRAILVLWGFDDIDELWPALDPKLNELVDDALAEVADPNTGFRRAEPLRGFDHDGTFVVNPFVSECGRFDVTDPDAAWGPKWRESFPELARGWDACLNAMQ